MPNRELFEQLLAAELKRRPLIFKVLGQEPEIYEIRKYKPLKLPPGETKVFTDTDLSRFLGSMPLWLCIFIVFFCSDQKLSCFFICCFVIFVCGIRQIFRSTFGRHKIEISDKGLLAEKDFYQWEQIKTVFFVKRPGKGESYRLAIALRDGSIKSYALSYYTDLTAPVISELQKYMSAYLSIDPTPPPTLHVVR